MLGAHANDVPVGLDAERGRDNQRDARAAEARVAALELDDCIDEICRGPLGPSLPCRFGESAQRPTDLALGAAIDTQSVIAASGAGSRWCLAYAPCFFARFASPSLQTFKLRLALLEKKATDKGLLLTEIQVAALERKREKQLKRASCLNQPAPGRGLTDVLAV